MSGQASTSRLIRATPGAMRRWQCWLFDWIARWEETSLIRSLGLPEDRVILVDLSDDD